MKVFFIAVMIFIAVPLTGHTPKNIGLDYDAETGMLSVEIKHGVNDPLKHFINKVVVELDGKKHVEQYFGKQADGENQRAIYKIIDAEEGSTLTVIAYCNISGRRKADLEVTLKKDEVIKD
ncbi:MAG: hypothetical protein JSW49_00360 [candidate division WOR-3 bacterium]|nr:MAG: hypothetical protein JSW49_00360 [candidate division WOR-3 bacterium]